jgi:hypothetical protein
MHSPECILHIPFKADHLFVRLARSLILHLVILFSAVLSGFLIAVISQALREPLPAALLVFCIAAVAVRGTISLVPSASFSRRKVCNPGSLDIKITDCEIEQGGTTIPFNSIRSATYRNGFVVTSHVCGSQVYILPEHKNYTDTLEEIARRSICFQPSRHYPQIIDGTWAAVKEISFPLSVALLMLLGSLHGDLGLYALGTTLSVLMICHLKNQHVTVTIHRGQVVLEGFLNKRTVIRLTDIESIRIESRKYRGKTITLPELTLTDGSVASIRFPEGSKTPAIYRAILDAFKRSSDLSTEPEGES